MTRPRLANGGGVDIGGRPSDLTLSPLLSKSARTMIHPRSFTWSEEPPAGIEPATIRLQGGRSAI
jgi:hypothetical protein